MRRVGERREEEMRTFITIEHILELEGREETEQI